MNIDNEELGTIVREEGRLGVRYRRLLAHRPQKVWRALTESEHLRHWMPCDLVGERRQGASLRVTFWPDVVEKCGITKPTLAGTINVWDPPHVFEWVWETDVLRWELEAVAAGTLLTFTTWPAGDEAVHKTAAGYHYCLAQLLELVDTGSVAGGFVETGARAWEPMYGQLLRTDESDEPVPVVPS